MLNESERNLFLKLMGIENGKVKGFSVEWYRGYWVLKGKFPLSEANSVYKTAPDHFSIRVSGGNIQNKPIDWCSSDKVTEEQAIKAEKLRSDKTYTVSMFAKEIEALRKELLKSEPENFYVGTYHIDTLEGLNYMVQRIKSLPGLNYSL